MGKKIPRLKQLQEVMKGQDESKTKGLTQHQFQTAKKVFQLSTWDKPFGL